MKPHTTVYSPPGHSAFDSPEGLLEFIAHLRELSGGQPVGFKLCLGKRREFAEICKTMLKTGIVPDFITVDGGEGGTGAAPVEFSNSIGAPLQDGLVFVHDVLTGFDLRKNLRLIATGKTISSFHLARIIALGAYSANSARAMMMATGCIQSLKCHENTCPVGVATQNLGLQRGLNVPDKARRVANYHSKTLRSFLELLATKGIIEPKQLCSEFIQKRVSPDMVLSLAEIYPEIEAGCFLNEHSIPQRYAPFLKP